MAESCSDNLLSCISILIFFGMDLYPSSSCRDTVWEDLMVCAEVFGVFFVEV